MADLKLVKDNNPEVLGKKIYYAVAGKLELAIPSVNIVNEENGMIIADEVYVISLTPNQFVPNQLNVKLASMKNVKIQYNLLVEMDDSDPIYNMVTQTMSGIARPH